MSNDTPSASVRIAPPDLLRFSKEVLISAGLSAEKAHTIADCLVTAECWGIDSHGVGRLAIYARRIREGLVSGARDPVVVSAKGSALVIDGANNPGAVAGSFAMRKAIETARTCGVSFATVCNSNHFGVAGYYTRMAVEESMIGLCGTNTPPVMTVWGASEPALGTNPLTIASPAGKYGRALLDMSSSIVARGKIIASARKGLPVPEGWALDPKGHPTTDAQAACDGVVLPFAGPKGSGLAIFLDILSGVLSGAGFGGRVGDQYTDFEKPQNAGHFFIAIDIAAFMPLAAYLARIEAYFDELKSRRLAPGVQEILLPGEPEARREAEIQREGIPIDPSLRHLIGQIAADFKVQSPFLITT